MDDRLKEIYKTLKADAIIFQSGLLCQAIAYAPTQSSTYLHILQEGALDVQLPDGSRLTVDEPSLLLFIRPPKHKLEPIKGNCRIVCASFSLGNGSSNPLLTSLPNFVLLPLSSIEGLQSILDTFARESDKQDCGFSIIQNQLIEVIFVYLVRHMMKQGLVDTGVLAGLSDKKLCKAIESIHAAPGKDWSIEELATLSLMSRAKFSNEFRKIVGTTPGAYINQWRLNLVKSLLLEGKDIQLIADKVGYANSSSLIRAFKAQCDTTPAQWVKRQHQKNDEIKNSVK